MMALAKEQLILCLFFFFEIGGQLKVLIFFKPLSQHLFHLSQKMTSWYAISYSACLFLNACEAIGTFSGIYFVKQCLNTDAVLKQLLLYITVDVDISSDCKILNRVCL